MSNFDLIFVGYVVLKLGVLQFINDGLDLIEEYIFFKFDFEFFQYFIDVIVK